MIASDLIQLLSSPPLIMRTSLISILTRSFSQLPESKQILFHLESRNPLSRQIEPIIWGNSHCLASYFSTILYWIPYQVAIELSIPNPLTIHITIQSPPEFLLSSINGLILISQYLKYIAAYFNRRSWISHSSVDIIFPLAYSFDFQSTELSS